MFRRTVVAVGALVLLGIGSPVSAEPAPAARKGVPRLGAAGASEEISGRIAASTRGQSGPVRLVIELAGGKELAVLVAPDELCDRLGLSLKVDEEIMVVGRVMPGERPLLVTSVVVVDGRRVDIRDAAGGWAKPPEAEPREAEPVAPAELGEPANSP
ncbi:MAG: hypothetical protein P8R42_19420 [Candidatus Binatia bacterium]|nr:hypothetical protein [Candidatus Binatia bacterium]